MTMVTAVDTLASAYPLLDVHGLQRIVGSPVMPSGLRHKPGVSTTATLTHPDGRPWGWAQVVLGDRADKLDNARRRAASRGQSVMMRPLAGAGLGDGGWILWGRIDTDPRLHRARDDIASILPSLDQAIHSGTVAPLRYNALRRLVLRGTGRSGPLTADLVLRLTASHQQLSRSVLRRLVHLGVPVIAPLRPEGLPGTRRATLWPWVEGADLADLPDSGVARSAGTALATLHGVTRVAGGARLLERVRVEEDPRHGAQRAAMAATAIAPALGPRLDKIRPRLPQPWRRPEQIIHGDFSADQVVGSAGDLHLLDLDRLQLGEPHRDLGSFAASELRRTGEWGLTAEVLDGYGRDVDATALRDWTAQALLLRLTEPFRAASPTWRTDLERRLDEIEHILEQGVLR